MRTAPVALTWVSQSSSESVLTKHHSICSNERLNHSTISPFYHTAGGMQWYKISLAIPKACNIC